MPRGGFFLSIGGCLCPRDPGHGGPTGLRLGKTEGWAAGLTRQPNPRHVADASTTVVVVIVVVRVVRRLIVRRTHSGLLAARQLTLQGVEVRVVGAVLELSGHL